MIPALGEFALWIALPISIWGCVLAFLGGKWSRGDLVLSAERSTYAVTVLFVVAAAGIVTAFMGDQFQYWYVYNYSSINLHPFFKFSGLWAGQRGSLLFWGLNLSVFSSLAVWLNRTRNRELMPYANGVLLAFLVFFISISLFVTPPFEQLGFVPADGRGLNPQLQNYWIDDPSADDVHRVHIVQCALCVRHECAHGRPPGRPLDRGHEEVDPDELVLPYARGHLRDAMGL